MKQLQNLLRTKKLSFTRRLQKSFPEAEIFLVGGIVRDSILKRTSKDFDFVVRNIPIKKLIAWTTKEGRVDLVGRTFGVLKFNPKKSKLIESIDIALPRTEHAAGTGGYRDVKVQSKATLPIADDLSRRDFTINALAYNTATKELVDLYNGQKDITKKLIRTVGKPEQRFQEDYSRMLRAIRFSCQLGFMIEKQTWAALKKQMRHINKKNAGAFIVPRETIAKELIKAFVADPVKAFDLYDRSGAIEQLIPEMLKMKQCPQPRQFHAEGDVWKHTRLALENLSSTRFKKKFKDTLSSELFIALLFHDIGKPYTLQRKDRLRFNNHDVVGAQKTDEIMRRLKIASTGIDTEKIIWLVRRHMIVASTKHSVMKKTTIEKYFYSKQHPGQQLLQLTYADILATVPPNGKPETSGFQKLMKQINALKPILSKKRMLPPALLSGNEIMLIMKIKSGPQVGSIKKSVREAQLTKTLTTKKHARQFILKKFK